MTGTAGLDPRFQLALRPAEAGPVLTSVLGLAPGRAPEILDAKIDVDHGATVLYRLGERLVVATSDPGPAGAVFAEPLGLTVRVFPDDPALPGLAVAMDPAALADLVEKALGGGAEVIRARATPMRYRPGRRCTLRIDAWLRTPSGPARRTWFGKLYHDAGKAADAWDAMCLIEGAQPVRDGLLRVAHPAAFLPDVPMVVQDPVAGIPLETRIGPLTGPAGRLDRRARPGVLAAAEAVAALHSADVDTGQARPAAKDLRKLARRSAQGVAGIDPALADRIEALVAALDAEAGALPRVTAVGHGDCKPTQFLLGRGPARPSRSAAVLDFDHCGMADPAADTGNFAASLRQLALAQRHAWRPTAAGSARAVELDGLAGTFLDRYETCAGDAAGPALRERVAWYERLALLRKGLRVFARSPRSPMAAALIGAAEEGSR